MHELKIDFTPLLGKFEIASRKGVSGSQAGAGAHARSTGERKAVLFRGKGLEFEKFREFTHDDDASMIDWKASLRSKKLMVKTYSEEQNKDVIFLFDVSNSMAYSSTGKLKSEYGAEVVSSLGYAIAESGDNLGLVMFNESVAAYLPPTSGINQYMRMKKFLSDPKHYDGKFDFVKVIKQLMNLVKRPAILVIVSDFIGLKGDWKRSLEAAAGKFEMIGIMVRDPLDNDLPEVSGQVVVSDPFSQDELLIEPKRIGKAYKSVSQKIMKDVKLSFQSTQSDFIILNTGESFVRPLRRLFLGG